MKLSLPRWQLSSDRTWLILLMMAAIAIFGVNLGNMPLRDWDEGYRAIIAREIAETNHWLYRTYFGEPYLSKPPLVDWLIALSYRFFGEISEFTSRAPVALISALAVPSLYAVVRELTPHQRTAIYSSAVYLTLLAVVRHGRLLMLDGTINTLYIVAILCLLKAKKTLPWGIGLGLALGAIALIKGILVLALGGIIFSFIIWDRRWSIFKNFYAWGGVLIGFGVAIAWHLLEWQHYGDLFIQQYFGTQNFARITSSVDSHDGAPWYYLLEVAKYSFPWLFFLPGGLWLAWQERTRTQGKLILSGAILFLIIVSVMGTKLPWYIMPFYPFFCLAVGLQLADLHRQFQRVIAALWGLFAVISVLCLGGIIYFVLTDPQWQLILMAIALSGTTGYAAWYLKQRNLRFIPVLFVGTYGSLFLLMMSQAWVWEINEAFPVVRVGAMVAEAVPADQQVYTSFGYNRPSLDFYSRHLIQPAPHDQLAALHDAGHYLLLEEPLVNQWDFAKPNIINTVDGFSLIQPRRSP